MEIRNNKAIPLEESADWWWYKAKKNLLNFILINLNLNKDIRILEIGPGKGNNINTLRSFGKVDVLENEITFIEYLKKHKFKNISNYFKRLEEINYKYDLIILLDVLEHIEESESFLYKLKHILNENGSIIIGVPAYKFLWSVHDERLKHFRRYTWKILKAESKDYKIFKRYGFNYLLLPIRYLQIKFSNNIHTVNESSKLVNKILFFISKIENFLRKFRINPKFGISLYAILKHK